MIIYLHKIPEDKIKNVLDAYYEVTGVMPWYLDPLKTDKIEFANSKLAKQKTSTVRTKFFGDDVICLESKDKSVFRELIVDHKIKLFGERFAELSLGSNELYIAAKNSKISVAFVDTNGISDLLVNKGNSAVFYLKEDGVPVENKKNQAAVLNPEYLDPYSSEEMKFIEINSGDTYELLVSKITDAFSSAKMEEKVAVEIGKKNAKEEESIRVYTGSKLVEISKGLLRKKESKISENISKREVAHFMEAVFGKQMAA